MDDAGNLRSTYKSSTRSKHSNRNLNSYPVNSNYRDENDEEEDEYGVDELGEEDEEINNEFDDQEEEEEEEEDDDDQEEQEDVENGYGESKRRPKKRRIENLVSNYEFAPRKPSNPPAEWTDHSTFLLLEAWGDRFMQLGRKSLRSEDWQEVAEKVSEASKVEWTDAQCRNRLDSLKKKYKKEKEKLESMGGGDSSKWGFFKKMDMLLNSSSAREHVGLPCGIDSGEYVFMNPRVYLNRSNGLDEMRDSSDESESFEDDEDSDGLPPKRDGSSFGLLADSVKKFGEIYEKIESSKRQQMMELEKMRVDFQRELEVQKKQILERAQAEIAKIRGEDDDETDGSAENFSG